MIKIVCNRCGDEIEQPGKIGYIALNFRKELGGEFESANMFENSHFCSVCLEKIANYIKNPEHNENSGNKSPKKNEKAETPTNEDKGKPAAPEPKDDEAAKPRRRRIDYGKIMALHNAGWDNAKIADEMDMNKTSVSTAICIYKKKMREAAYSRDPV